jgi:hypothetical protein
MRKAGFAAGRIIRRNADHRPAVGKPAHRLQVDDPPVHPALLEM